MARFQFIRRGIAANPRAHSVVSRHSLRALRLQDDEEDERGPGWFASSWELVRGLEVREAAPGDTRLHEWLGGMRSGDRHAGAVASGLTECDVEPGAGLVPVAPHGALGHAAQLGDLGFAVAAEVTHLDQFSEFGIDGLELV